MAGEPITADNITDEEIRELWAEALDHGDRTAAQRCQVALGTWHAAHNWEASCIDYTCGCAWRHPDREACGRHASDDGIHIYAARARCAEILNTHPTHGEGA